MTNFYDNLGELEVLDIPVTLSTLDEAFALYRAKPTGENRRLLLAAMDWREDDYFAAGVR